MHNFGFGVYPSPFAVFLNADDKIYLEPDISVICDKNKLTEKSCQGAPDWIMEVTYEEYSFTDKVKAGIYEDLENDTNQIGF